MEATAPKERASEGGSTSPHQDVHACQGGENVHSIADAKGSVKGTSAMMEMEDFCRKSKKREKEKATRIAGAPTESLLFEICQAEGGGREGWSF